MKELQAKLRQYLSLNNLKEGTKAAYKSEHAFLHGYLLNRREPNPAVLVCLMSGRSILTVEIVQ